MTYRLVVVPGDNQILRELSSHFSGDVEVQVIDSANDALWEIRQSSPSAIIADVNLPGMSGLDLAEIVPNFGLPTKVVLWSVEPDQQAEKQAVAHGADRFLNGPQSPDQLKRVLYEVMEQAQREAATPEPNATPTPVRPAAPTPVAAPAIKPAVDSERAAPTPVPARPAQSASTRPPSPAAPAATPEPARRPTSRRRPEGPLVLTAERIQPIKGRMNELLQEVGAEYIVLTDRNGMVLTEAGKAGGIPTMILLPMLSTSFSAAGQISQMLREPESNALYVQEGRHYDLYCFDILQSFMMVLIFDKRVAASKIGTVWVYAKRAIRDIQTHLS